MNIDNGQFIPNKFINDNGKEISVDFSYITQDGNNAYNAISIDAVSTFIIGINEASKVIDIVSIGISATTNGEHSTSSNHYKHNGARAFDISTINKMPVGHSINKNAVLQIQKSMNQYSMIRENYGPGLKTKNNNPINVGGHTNHIHISINQK